MLKKKSLAIVNLVYWFLLLYIVAALVWWFIALQQQNHQMTNYKLLELKGDDPAYIHKVEQITDEEKRKTHRNIGEGTAFLLIIIIGAIFVYRAVHKQFRLSQQQQNFMMAVTHELKTPIAITRLNLETVLKHKLDDSKQEQIFHKTLAEIGRLDTLANNILISSQLEAGGYRMAKEELDLSALARDTVTGFSSRFPERVWKVNIEPEIYLQGDNLLLQILISNLLDNAIKYSPKTSEVEFNLLKDQKAVKMEVKDQGYGIPEQERKKIFERFYRIGSEKTRSAKGTGLGLFLCRKIVADHNGDILVTNNHPAGSNFVIHFKL